jgi:hypothetical protein
MATKRRRSRQSPLAPKCHGGVSEMGTNADNTMYSMRETDHHAGEPAIVHHSDNAPSRA